MAGGAWTDAEALLAAGEPDRAAACALAAAAAHPDAWGVVVRARRALGDRAGAAEAATHWVAACPGSGPAWHALGGAMLGVGQAAQAVMALEQAASRAPSATVLSDLGLALRRSGRPEAAHAVLDRAVSAEPASVVARLGRASLRSWAGDDAGALRDLDAALEGAPGDPALLGARALALQGLGRPDAALATLASARARAPGDARLAWNEALALLAAGRFEEGFAAYGARRQRQRQRGAARVPGVPLWAGGPLDGRTLLVLGEQGFGDTLQFARFCGPLAARGASVWVRAHRRLGAMLSRVPGVAGFVSKDEPVPQVDIQVSMMDVPGLLGCGEAELGAAVPYLSAPGAGAATLLGARRPGVLRVGLGWQGNPGFEADHLRSPPLRHFAPLARVPGAAFVCLQQRDGRDQLPGSPVPMLDVAPALDTGPDGFVDTAAVLDALDLVITSDTALAHLAGGMGRPTWVVLPFSADWRWLVARSDSPWYPTMRLFRQPTPGAWGPVFDAVAAALGRVVAGEEPP